MTSEIVEGDRKLTVTRKADRSAEATSGRSYAIFIRNLPTNVSQSQLKEAFLEFGAIMHSSVSCDEKGNSRGFGIVEFQTREAAEAAQANMDQATFNKQEVSVALAFD